MSKTVKIILGVVGVIVVVVAVMMFTGGGVTAEDVEQGKKTDEQVEKALDQGDTREEIKVENKDSLENAAGITDDFDPAAEL